MFTIYKQVLYGKYTLFLILHDYILDFRNGFLVLPGRLKQKKQDQIGLERSARWSCSVFCVLCSVYCGRGCVSLESERGKELA